MKPYFILWHPITAQQKACLRQASPNNGLPIVIWVSRFGLSSQQCSEVMWAFYEHQRLRASRELMRLSDQRVCMTWSTLWQAAKSNMYKLRRLLLAASMAFWVFIFNSLVETCSMRSFHGFTSLSSLLLHYDFLRGPFSSRAGSAAQGPR